MARILIVEDDTSTREFLKFVLENAGFRVEAVGDGQAALDSVTAQPPDLVLLDIMLPEVHGYEVCHRIKSNEALKKVKVLMLSAKSFPADRRQASQVGADGFLAKPVNPVDLVQTVKIQLGETGPSN